MAKKFWPDQDPLGKRFRGKGASGHSFEVVGVVQDGKYKGVVETPAPFFYQPLNQSYIPLRTFHLRTSVPPENLSMQVQSQIRSLAPNLSVSELQTMDQALQGVNGFLLYRLGAQFTGTMGVLGLILAVVDVYSVASYAAAQRTRRARLVTGAVLPVFNHPLKLAGEIGMLDAISDGRLDVGFARAFLPHEFRRFGRSPDESVARFREGIEQVELLEATLQREDCPEEFFTMRATAERQPGDVLFGTFHTWDQDDVS